MSNTTTTTTDTTSAAEVVTSAVVTELEKEADSVITAKIKELATEIATTRSIWVKLRNAAEISILSLALAKAVNKLKEIKD